MILNYCLAIASGLMLVFAYPGWDDSFLVWLWLLPLLYALFQGRTQAHPLRRGFTLGYLAGLAFFIPNLFWVRHSSRVISGAYDNHWMGWNVELMGWGVVVGLAAYCSIFWGLWGMLAATVGKPNILGRTSSLLAAPSTRVSLDPKDRVPVAKALFSASFESLRTGFMCASAWVGLEWVRGTLFTGFGWNGLGVPLAHDPSLIQSADLVGVTGLAFLPVFCTCIGYNTVLRFIEEVRTSRVRPHFDFFIAAILVLADVGYGLQVLLTPEPKDSIPLRVLLVQQNIPQVDVWQRSNPEGVKEGYYDLTAACWNHPIHADLVVWPESALPQTVFEPQTLEFLDRTLMLGDFSLLSGVDIYEPLKPFYTGAALMRGRVDNYQLYRKIHLVPFGEYLPFRDVGIVKNLLGKVIPGDFTPGEDTNPLTLEKPQGVQIIPLICFEDTVGDLARRFVRASPQLIVNMTNDGWFLHSEENEVHLANALFRCIELRRPMARAANTGVSCFVDIHGHVGKGDRLEDKKSGKGVFTKGTLPKELHLDPHPPMTLYALHGDLFSQVMLVLAALGWGSYGYIKRKGREREASAASEALNS